MLVGYRKQPNPLNPHGPGLDLTPEQAAFNKLLSFYRARIEQVNAYVKAHDLFEGRRFRGDLDFLDDLVCITVHSTAALIRLEKDTRQLAGFGWWKHA